jgi:peptidoglycan/LPS O-acetylase OafA/YrhL
MAAGEKTVAAIQALRALAVTAVVVDHAFPHALPGGFAGVDIFFVISGFLITGHLMREIEERRFSFAGFYLRRARRLLPAAVLVLAVTAVATLVLLPPAWHAQTLQGVAAAAVYAVNWWLAASAVDYFADGGITSPVNHYWSLSVEEQFYLIWPALIVAALAGARAAGWRGGRVVAGVLAGVVVLSFAAGLFAMAEDRTAAYFVTQGRAWEFAVGGLAALVQRAGVGAGRAGPWLLAAGWGVLAAEMARLHPGAEVPGRDAVPVVLATAVLLVLGDRHGLAPAARAMALAPVRWLGDVSYSLYLWHWPLIVFAPFALGVEEVGVPAMLGVLALALMLSQATHAGVENRWRRPQPGARARPAGVALAGWLGLSLAAGGGAWAVAGLRLAEAEAVALRLHDLSVDPPACFGARAAEPGARCPAPHRLADPDYALQTWESQRVPVPNGTLCQTAPGEATPAPCAFGAAEGEERARIALLGDSHAGMWGAALATFAEAEGIRVEVWLASSCAATEDAASFALYLAPDRRPGCLAWRRAATHAILADRRIETVVVSANAHAQARWTGEAWAEDDGAGFAALWQRLIAAGKRVVVLDDVPMLPARLPDCLARPHDPADPCAHPAAAVPEVTVLGRAVARLPAGAVTHVTFRDVFCDAATCHAVVGGLPAYMDADHISAPLARTLAPRIAAALGLAPG